MKMNMKMLIMCVMLFASLGASALAFEIESPTNETYANGSILFNVTHNESLDSIWGKLDDGAPVMLCTNCSSYSMMLNLTEGGHVIGAYALSGLIELNDSVSFTVAAGNASEDNSTVGNTSFSVSIAKPTASVYQNLSVPLEIGANATLDSLSYRLDNGSYVQACANCSSYATTLALGEGNHTIVVRGVLGNRTEEAARAFSVKLPVAENFTLNVASPLAKTYYKGNIGVSISSNETLDRIEVDVAGQEYSCTNCSTLSRNLSLSPGNYSLVASGRSGGAVKEVTVAFRVVNTTWNNTTNASSNTPRFSLGFEKLPKAVESGNISDEELAQIIRSNKLNPGVINRLIKTGMLGNESIDAILETQFKPQGIFRKLLAFMGISDSSYADGIYAMYGHKEHVQNKLVTRDDLGEDELESLKHDIEERDNKLRSEYGNKSHEGQGNSLNLGKQDNAPGQEKKSGIFGTGSGNKGKGGNPGGKGNGSGPDGGSHSNGKGKGNGKSD